MVITPRRLPRRRSWLRRISGWIAKGALIFLVDSEPLQDERVAEAEESQVRHELLIEAMQALNDRERHILTERRLTDEPKTLEELSQVYDVSRERIRQIEVRAFEKLQKALMNLAGERRLLSAA